MKQKNRKILGKLIGNRPSAVFSDEIGEFIKPINVEPKKTHIEEQLDQALKDYDELQERIEKTIDHINNATFTINEYEKRLLLKILKGE